MSKRRITLSFRLPPYLSPRNDWRKRIHKLALEAVHTRNITLLESDQLQIDVTLYLENSALKFHDVDNRLKDIMDALQGRVGGTERKQILEPPPPPSTNLPGNTPGRPWIGRTGDTLTIG